MKLKNEMKHILDKSYRAQTEITSNPGDFSGNNRNYNTSSLSMRGTGYKNSKMHRQVELRNYIKDTIEEQMIGVKETLKLEM